MASSETSVPTATSAAGSTQHSSTGVGESSSGLMSALKQAKEAVEEGMGLVRSRQKVIRLADRSKLGWAVVNEYREDELADDSDDEKRIARAVATAEKKEAQLRKKNLAVGLTHRPGQ